MTIAQFSARSCDVCQQFGKRGYTYVCDDGLIRCDRCLFRAERHEETHG